MVKKKRKVNRAFNSYIAPRKTDIERVEGQRSARIESYWQKKGCPK